jgi:hypothetical protein
MEKSAAPVTAKDHAMMSPSAIGPSFPSVVIVSVRAFVPSVTNISAVNNLQRVRDVADAHEYYGQQSHNVPARRITCLQDTDHRKMSADTAIC